MFFEPLIRNAVRLRFAELIFCPLSRFSFYLLFLKIRILNPDHRTASETQTGILMLGQAGACATKTLPSFAAQAPLSVNRRPYAFSLRACPCGGWDRYACHKME
jgi:hypothetical protein